MAQAVGGEERLRCDPEAFGDARDSVTGDYEITAARYGRRNGGGRRRRDDRCGDDGRGRNFDGRNVNGSNFSFDWRRGSCLGVVSRFGSASIRSFTSNVVTREVILLSIFGRRAQV